MVEPYPSWSGGLFMRNQGRTIFNILALGKLMLLLETLRHLWIKEMMLFISLHWGVQRQICSPWPATTALGSELTLGYSYISHYLFHPLLHFLKNSHFILSFIRCILQAAPNLCEARWDRPRNTTLQWSYRILGITLWEREREREEKRQRWDATLCDNTVINGQLPSWIHLSILKVGI